MKKFRLLMMAGLIALASGAQAQDKKIVISTAENVALAEDGTGEIVLNLNYPTEETLGGYNFSLMLPAGISADSKSGKWAPAVTLNMEIHPPLYDSDADDYTAAASKAALQIKDKADGGLLFIWIDQAEKTPLLKTEGQLMTIKIKAAEGFTGGEAKIYTVSVSNVKDESLDLGNIADVTFTIGGGSSEGINDIQAADSNAPIYNLQGVRVNSEAKGLLIQDGKKRIVK